MLLLMRISYQGHVDGGTEGDSRHRIEDIDEHLGQYAGSREEVAHCRDGCTAVDWDICNDVSET